jgi:hypothetical protein
MVKGIPMGWMNKLRSGKAKRADPLGAAVINRAPHDLYRAAEKSAVASVPEAEIPEEIKRRQTALLVSYVRAVRACIPT